MSGNAGSRVVSPVKAALLLSGWLVAIWLGYAKWSEAHQPEPMVVPQPVPLAPLPSPVTKASAMIPVPLPETPVVKPLVPEPAAFGSNPTEQAFKAWQENPALAGALIGFCLLDEKGEVVFASPLAQTALCPASALKTVTTGAAFGQLGNEFRFETSLVSTVEIDKDGTLSGDLVLVGGGDPTLSAEDLETLAEALVAKGLRKVTGELRVDASVFPANPMSDHWNWGDIGNAYGAGAFGLNVDHNRMVVRFHAGAEVGKPAQLAEGDKVQNLLRWENLVVTGEEGSGDQVVAYSRPYDRLVTLRGSVPLGASDFGVTVALPDPPAIALAIVRARLSKAGVTFLKQPKVDSPESKVVLVSHQSAPLPEIVDHLHRESDNLEAQCFFLMLGKRQSADPVAVVRQYWESAGVSPVGWRLLDGSGLARANMIRPLDLARINLAARNGPNGERFYQSLNLSKDGFSRGKLGAMSGVKTEVGFLRMPDGREFTYAVMANGLDTKLNFWKLKEGLLQAIREAGT